MKVGVSLRIRFEEEEKQLASEGNCMGHGYGHEGANVLLLLHQELNAQNVGLKVEMRPIWIFKSPSNPVHSENCPVHPGPLEVLFK